VPRGLTALLEIIRDIHRGRLDAGCAAGVRLKMRRFTLDIQTLAVGIEDKRPAIRMGNPGAFNFAMQFPLEQSHFSASDDNRASSILLAQ
jgi:hypothetical protein